MSNYNFTPTLNGLNNIEADEIQSTNIQSNNITANSGTIDNLNIGTIYGDTLTNCNLENCTVSDDPTDDLGIASKQYVDLCAKLSENNIFTGTTNRFDNNVRILGSVNITGTNLCGRLEVTGTADFNDTTNFSGTNNINGATIFNTLPTSSIVPTTENQLCNKYYIDNSSHSIAGYAKLADENNFTAKQLFNNGITVGSTPGFQFIDVGNPSSNFQLITNSNSTVHFGNASNTCTWRYNTFLDILKTKNITANITLGFPLVENNIIRNITLPEVDERHIGITIKFFKTRSTI